MSLRWRRAIAWPLAVVFLACEILLPRSRGRSVLELVVALIVSAFLLFYRAPSRHRETRQTQHTKIGVE